MSAHPYTMSDEQFSIWKAGEITKMVETYSASLDPEIMDEGDIAEAVAFASGPRLKGIFEPKPLATTLPCEPAGSIYDKSRSCAVSYVELGIMQHVYDAFDAHDFLDRHGTTSGQTAIHFRRFHHESLIDKPCGYGCGRHVQDDGAMDREWWVIWSHERLSAAQAAVDVPPFECKGCFAPVGSCPADVALPDGYGNWYEADATHCPVNSTVTFIVPMMNVRYLPTVVCNSCLCTAIAQWKGVSMGHISYLDLSDLLLLAQNLYRPREGFAPLAARDLLRNLMLASRNEAEWLGILCQPAYFDLAYMIIKRTRSDKSKYISI